MALPLILGMAGSALAPTIGMTPFIASSIGSGLGRLIEGGTIDDAIGTGLMTYFGGKALGSVFGAGAGAGAPEATANAMSQATPFTAGATTGTAMSSVPAGAYPLYLKCPLTLPLLPVFLALRRALRLPQLDCKALWTR